MARNQNQSDTLRFKPGAKVRVKLGVHDPDFADIPLGGWPTVLAGGRFPEGVSHLDPATGRPVVWPLPFSWAAWEVKLEGLEGLEAWSYEFRAWAVDLNGYAQPEPRPNPQSGIAEVPCMPFTVA